MHPKIFELLRTLQKLSRIDERLRSAGMAEDAAEWWNQPDTLFNMRTSTTNGLLLIWQLILDPVNDNEPTAVIELSWPPEEQSSFVTLMFPGGDADWLLTASLTPDQAAILGVEFEDIENLRLTTDEAALVIVDKMARYYLGRQRVQERITVTA